ncbi:MAG: hypothetical protein CM15mV25_0730 [uncultured marine virus]|nr:MAG: hypothetical protein CM15mV25_0730 [uncultured marine virus]
MKREKASQTFVDKNHLEDGKGTIKLEQDDTSTGKGPS